MTNVAYPMDHVTPEEAKATFDAELAYADHLAELQGQTRDRVAIADPEPEAS